MPLSLADRILSYRNTEGRRGAARRGRNDEGSPAVPILFGNVARDGSGLLEAVGDLKRALVGSAVEQAIGAAGIRAAMEPEGGRLLQGGDAEPPRGFEEAR